MDHPDIIKNGLQIEGEETDKFDDFYDKIPDEYIKVMKVNSTHRVLNEI